MNKASLIEFSKIGRPEIGYISVAEIEDKIPFEMKRIFWTYHTPEDIIRGRHAHHATEMVLIAVAGRIVVNTEMIPDQVESFVLDRPNLGVYMPPMCWHTMQYSHNAVQMVITSSKYQPEDYIRSYDEFRELYENIN